MNINIKNISITQYLIANGYESVKSAYGATWFNSPLREGDKKPSFKVDENKNVWFDHGSGIGGTLFTLIRELYNISDREVFVILEGLDPSYQSIPLKQSSQSSLRIDQVVSLQSRLLSEYLSNRGIELRFARQHISEIHYSIREKKYYAIGFKNDKGGWELRNKHWKGSSSPKYFRTIQGKESGLNVFEGFIDYLSALTYFKSPFLKNTTIVLNSVSFVKSLIPLLDSYTQVNLFLDNDTAGENTMKAIISTHSNTRNYAKEFYPDHKDFNEMLMTIKK